MITKNLIHSDHWFKKLDKYNINPLQAKIKNEMKKKEMKMKIEELFDDSGIAQVQRVFFPCHLFHLLNLGLERLD